MQNFDATLHQRRREQKPAVTTHRILLRANQREPAGTSGVGERIQCVLKLGCCSELVPKHFASGPVKACLFGTPGKMLTVPSVVDSLSFQAACQPLAIELRVTAGVRLPAHVDDTIDSVTFQDGDKVFAGMTAVAESVNGCGRLRFHRLQAVRPDSATNRTASVIQQPPQGGPS